MPATSPAMDGPRLEPASGGPARRLIVFLHGVGADGGDLIGLAPYFAERLPDAAFVSPDAPFPFDMAPFGRQWFSLQDRSPNAIYLGVTAAAPLLDAYLDRELAARGLKDADLALVGFSQGTMMSLYVGPRRAAPCAAIVGFSGRLIAPERLAGEIRSRPPVLLVHGDADPMVPFASLAQAEAELSRLGVPVKALARPGLAHAIDEAGLLAAVDHVAGAFGA